MPTVDLTTGLLPGHVYSFGFNHPGLVRMYALSHPAFPQQVADYVAQHSGSDVEVVAHGIVDDSTDPDNPTGLLYAVAVRVKSMAAYNESDSGTTPAQVGAVAVSAAVIVSAIVFALEWPSIRDFLVKLVDTGSNPSSPLSKIADAARVSAWAAAGFALAFVIALSRKRSPVL